VIDEKRYAAWFRKEGLLSSDEMTAALDEKFRCPRCGRNDLPLALFPHHDKSCRFECGHLIAGAAMDVVEEKNQKIEDLEERIEQLEKGVREGIRVIQWFGGWLNGRTKPVTYDDARCTCGHRGSQHNGTGRCMDPDNVTLDDDGCECDQYTPTTYSVSYTARDVAHCVNYMSKLLPLAPPVTEKWCKGRCKGRFDLVHMRGDICVWCDKAKDYL
jgi:transcription elongation factor Elf1